MSREINDEKIERIVNELDQMIYVESGALGSGCRTCLPQGKRGTGTAQARYDLPQQE